MNHTLHLANGDVEAVYSSADFENLLSYHLGYEAAQFYREQVESLIETILEANSLLAKIQNTITDLDNQVDLVAEKTDVTKVVDEFGW